MPTPIVDIYEQELGRTGEQEIEQAGMTFYRDQLASGKSLEQIRAEIGASPEGVRYDTPAPSPSALPPVTPYTPPVYEGGITRPPLAPIEPRALTPKETVAGQMDLITAKGSPWMRQAGQIGTEYASGRGMLASSVEAGAVEAERIKAALQIAQPTAQAYERAGMSAQEAQQLQQSDVLRADLQNELKIQEIAFQGVTLAERERYATESNFRQAQTEINADMEQFYTQITLDNRKAFTEVTAPMIQQYWSEFGKIMTSDFLGPNGKKAASDDLYAHFYDGTNLVAAQYNVDLEWGEYEPTFPAG